MYFFLFKFELSHISAEEKSWTADAKGGQKTCSVTKKRKE